MYFSHPVLWVLLSLSVVFPLLPIAVPALCSALSELLQAGGVTLWVFYFTSVAWPWCAARSPDSAVCALRTELYQPVPSEAILTQIPWELVLKWPQAGPSLHGSCAHQCASWSLILGVCICGKKTHIYFLYTVSLMCYVQHECLSGFYFFLRLLLLNIRIFSTSS